MGGKGQRRREKNYKAAHGDNSRLPPPPKPSDLDALPSKLRRIIDFKTPAPIGSLKFSTDTKHKRRNGDVAGDQKVNSKGKDACGSNASKFKEGGNNDKMRAPNPEVDRDEITNTNAHDKKKGKRKRKAVDDLRFQKLGQDMSATGLTKRERKKKYLEERKKKHKKAKTEILDFPGCEEIKFGEVVEAPPKLNFPKALKTIQGASHERLRIQAVEAYRNRKGWVSRPGVHLPPGTPTLLS
ncbi:uncharacterized protein LOC131248440 [Magnolia sinica]|uniref:uncharacterized protein LOC131248440 n=1 Tax=Magnolia sinica TaxID=86752 RepID=UPI002658C7F2|nr:uncharacterized protein LOC131248440 [Magnolia sinica]XP_058104705.1 uncharacterized protein LOC131248440 [Magnolia sinica]